MSASRTRVVWSRDDHLVRDDVSTGLGTAAPLRHGKNDERRLAGQRVPVNGSRGPRRLRALRPSLPAPRPRHDTRSRFLMANAAAALGARTSHRFPRSPPFPMHRAITSRYHSPYHGPSRPRVRAHARTHPAVRMRGHRAVTMTTTTHVRERSAEGTRDDRRPPPLVFSTVHARLTIFSRLVTWPGSPPVLHNWLVRGVTLRTWCSFAPHAFESRKREQLEPFNKRGAARRSVFGLDYNIISFTV